MVALCNRTLAVREFGRGRKFMRHLILFVSEGESGAPGYLSQLGEDGAANLAESLKLFVAGLGIALPRTEGGLDSQPKSFKSPSEAASHEPNVLVLASTGVRSQKTAEIWTKHLGVPAYFEECLNESASPVNEPGSIVPNTVAGGSGISRCLEKIFQQDALPGASRFSLPPLIIVQSSLQSILAWVEQYAPPDLQTSILESLQISSESDRIPALLAVGYEGPWPGIWLFD